MKAVYENPWFKVVAQDGFHWVEETNARQGAAVLCIVDDRDVLLVQVRRRAQNSELALEIPRGYANQGETSADCGRRELFEETGFKVDAGRFQELGRCLPNSAILATTVTLYLATATSQDRISDHDDEVEGVVQLPLAQVRELMLSGKLQDGFTLAALAYYQARKSPLPEPGI